MATLIPKISACVGKMTSGEKRVARRLESHLEDDYYCWFDIPVGGKRRYPDFIVLHAARGLLFLEVKDWKLETIRKISKSNVELLTDNGRVSTANPIEQARQYTYQAINRLQRDPQLTNSDGPHKGKLCFPYGYGVVLTNITRTSLEKALNADVENVLPAHLVICKDELANSVDPEEFQSHLWGMFNYAFNTKLSLPQVDQIRGNLFPELLVDPPAPDLFDDDSVEEESLPVQQVIKIMDKHQEQLARGLGGGHRVIHGVAGSGKTMILGFRCLYLAEALSKPTLVLCFNVTLAAKLRSYVAEKGVSDKVQVYHFHDWCGQQLKLYHVDVEEGTEPFWERQVSTVISAVESGAIPRAQYGAVLIDEGHDFEPEWLKLVSQMVDPETDSLLLLYDDAQSIYRKRHGLSFSLASVGIQARGRTTILQLNYRNTREILEFAYQFAEEFIGVDEDPDDDIPVVAPESSGSSGPAPVVRMFESAAEESKFVVRCISKWLAEGRPANEIALLCPSRDSAERMAKALASNDIDHLCMLDKKTKSAYDPSLPLISVLTVHSSKGLEFDTAVMVNVGQYPTGEDDLGVQARLMYVGMTRAKQNLLITASAESEITDRLVELVAP